MEKKVLIYISTIFIVLICILLSFSHIFSPSATFEEELKPTTKAVFIGQTQLSGLFHGFSYTELPDNPLIEELYAFPFFGPLKIKNVDQVMVLNLEEIKTASLFDLIALKENAPCFSDVTISSDEHPIILGTTQGTISVDSNLAYAITAQLPLQYAGSINQFLAVVTSSNLPLQYTGEQVILMPLYEESTFQILDHNGNMLWENTDSDSILFIEDDEFICTQQSPLHLFPLIPQTTSSDVHLFIQPADPNTIDIQSLVQEVSAIAESLDETDLTENIQELDTFIDLAASFINGGMIFINPQDALVIDDSTQEIKDIGFARTNQIDVTISTDVQSPTTQINGESRLFFLGDHLYTAPTQGDTAGVYLPIFIIIVWIVSLVSYFLIRFYTRTEIDEHLDQSLKKYSSFLHIIALIIMFILIDVELQYQLGISMLSTLTSHGASFVVLFIFTLQIILWVVGYLLLAVPLRIFIQSVFKFIGVRKGGKGLYKGLSLIGVWLFCVLYTQLMINLVFIIIQPGNFFQIG